MHLLKFYVLWVGMFVWVNGMYAVIGLGLHNYEKESCSFINRFAITFAVLIQFILYIIYIIAQSRMFFLFVCF